MPHPYLSFVATARNDNHGGDLLHRVQVFVNALAAQCTRFGLDAELVLVEWNPPADRRRLADVVEWPEENERLAVRILEVPAERHRQLAHSDRLPLFQMIAKNVGIRRARAPFVVATNVDVLFDDALMAELASRSLRPGTLYRADRHDTDATLDPSAPVEELLAASASSLVRICRLDGTYDVRTGEYFQIYGPLTHLPGPLARWTRLVSFALPLAVAYGRGAVRRSRRRLRRWHLARTRREPGPRTFTSGIDLADVLAVVRERLALLGQQVAEQNRLIAEMWLHEKARVRVHSNACGDFTLLARADWERVGGYAELEMFSLHLDSLLLYEAHYAGLRQQVLPGAVYHLEHGMGFKPDVESLRTLTERIESAAIPQVSNDLFMEWIIEMYRRRGPMRMNTPAWGFAGETFAETDPYAKAPARLRVAE